MQHVGRRGEDLLHLVRLRDHHERRAAGEVDREALPVTSAPALERRERPRPERHALDEGRRTRARWEGRPLHCLEHYPICTRSYVRKGTPGGGRVLANARLPSLVRGDWRTHTKEYRWRRARAG